MLALAAKVKVMGRKRGSSSHCPRTLLVCEVLKAQVRAQQEQNSSWPPGSGVEAGGSVVKLDTAVKFSLEASTVWAQPVRSGKAQI